MTVNLMRNIATGLVLTALAILPAAAASAHDSQPGQLHISVSGSASAAPDLARLNAGVVARAETASAAMAAQREQMTRVMLAIRKIGIADRDIRTSGLNLSPLYDRGDRRTSPPRITGYQATNQVTVVVRDLTKVGSGLDALVEAGVNNIGHVSFGFSDQSKLIEQARANALDELKKRRAFYAEAGGLKVGRLISLSEGGGHRPPQPMMMMDRAETMKSSTPIAPGESEITISLSATYEIGE